MHSKPLSDEEDSWSRGCRAGDVTALWAQTVKGLFSGTEDSFVTQELPLDPRSSGPCDSEECKKRQHCAADLGDLC